MEKIYNKLVRDRIPEIIENNGETPITRVLDNQEYKKELEKKLLEEYNEVLETTSSNDRLEELADMLEVMVSLATLENANLNDIITIMNEKKEKRGGFSKKFFLEKVQSNWKKL